MSDSFKVKNKLNIAPKATAGTAAGDLRVDSADNTLKFHDGSTEEDVVLQPALDDVIADAASDLATHAADTSTHGVTTVAGLD
jgi:hypothetical protein